MQTFCRHEPHVKIDSIWEPKYSTDEILIATQKIPEHIEHILIKFRSCTKYPDWFYMSAKMVREYPVQANGRGQVFVVPMATRQDFKPVVKCNHVD